MTDSSLEDLPQPVKDYILEEAHKEYELKNYRFSISELVYCLKKPFYRRKHPVPADITKAWYFFRGRLFHEAFGKLFPKNEVPMTYRIKGTPIVVSGRLDIMHEGRIIEFKTTNSLKYVSEVKPQHRKQAVFYAWCQGLDKAEVIYLDLNNVKKFEVKVEEAVVDEIEMLAKTLYSSIQSDTPPPPLNREKWECRKEFCEYYDECGDKTV